LEDKDTAEVARRIHSKKIHGLGAIASKNAAKLYGLEIIASNIQSIKNNATRFAILQARAATSHSDIDKASFKFVLDHKRGSLAAILNVLSDCSINLTKIQSLPIIKTPWKYAFFVDVTFEDVLHYEKAKSVLEIMTESFKIHGAYKNKKQ
jgi:prephenate dehydratase